MSASPIKSTSSSDMVAKGHAALVQGEWETAKGLFEAILHSHQTPEALEGLGTAVWYLDEGEATLDAREQAYLLYRRQKDHVSAARMAILLAWDWLTFRGQPAMSNGWVRRAERLLDGHSLTPEHGWLAAHEAVTALVRQETHLARDLAVKTAECGRALDLVDLEVLGVALEGLVLASEGEVDEALARLDEAGIAIVAGELTDLTAIGLASCYLIDGCARLRDYHRAVQWCQRLEEFAARWQMNALFAVCRIHYAEILMWRGQWDRADAELSAATVELRSNRPGMVGEGMVGLAELRRRQGRFEESRQLFDQAEHHPRALVGSAALAIDEGDPERALAWLDKFMRRVPAQNRTERAAGLELLVTAALATRDWVSAANALAELKAIAEHLRTGPLLAAVAVAEALSAASGGDDEVALQHFEHAIDLYHQSEAQLEAALARLGAADTALRLAPRVEHLDAAERHARAAHAVFEELGVRHKANAASDLLVRTGVARTMASVEDHRCLTKRECEVLELVAEGMTNAEIALRLFLSAHTVHRHVANILQKLDVPTRAAAVAHHLADGTPASVR